MPRVSNTLKGYVKTSNLYLTVLVTLAIGFLGGVLFSSYRSASIAPAANQPPSPSTSATVPLTKEQSQTLAALTKATRATPDNVRAWTQLGHFYFDVGRIKKAIEAYQKSLSLDADRPDIWTDIGVMHRRNGDPEKAIESFDRALSINGRHEVAMFNKGVVLMHDFNDAKAALNTWEMLVQINPNAKAPNGQLVQTLVTQLKNNNPS
jgi:cytochrome c-type biogenesis protein CcmH/NrfG